MQTNSQRLLFALVLLNGPSAPLIAESPLPDTIQFNRDVRPILSDNCFLCHGPDANHRQSELRLDMRESALKSFAFDSDKPNQDGLVARVFSDQADQQMPPPDSHKKLSPRQKSILKLWIDQGAVYQQHWAYEKPVKTVIPAGQNGVDLLVRKRWMEVGLQSAAQADRRTLIRRLYFDLLGLPPTPEEVAEFLHDSSDENGAVSAVTSNTAKANTAYLSLVDRVLQNPHFGERMAIHWLDVVRFADTAGYHSDNPRNVWPYRDWVIQSFNDNKRFDRFTLEQIAGDLMPDKSQETLVGSAFNRLLLSTEEGGAQPKDYEARMLTDRVRAIGAAWMGQTTGCAQCHDHKFDPLKTRDFYALGAFFADIQEPIVGRREDGMVVVTADQKTTCLVSASLPNKRTVRVLPRGNWMDESGEIVEPAFPTYLPQSDVAGRKLTRLDLAQWLISRENPLTARTVMNRLWQQCFETGLSKVLDDLGAQGEMPPNLALLDWLACEFMDSGWDFKHMVRLIVTSETYRQTSVATSEQLTADPYNREHARQSAFRIDAELIRDNALAISGLLDSKMGGPSVKPYQPDGYWENLNFPTRDYLADKDSSQYRRGLYTWWQRSFLHPSLLAFDAPSREECCAERNRSNIPQQALVLLNDPTYVEAARVFAARILSQRLGSAEERLAWAWQQSLQRPPRAEEMKTMIELLNSHLEDYRKDVKRAADLLKVGNSPSLDSLDKSELAAWTHIARVLLNLHETITRS